MTYLNVLLPIILINTKHKKPDVQYLNYLLFYSIKGDNFDIFCWFLVYTVIWRTQRSCKNKITTYLIFRSLGNLSNSISSPNVLNVHASRELRRSSRHYLVDGPGPRTYGEGSAPLATPSAAYLSTSLPRRAVANLRARPFGPERRRGILLCSDFSEHTRSPCDALNLLTPLIP